MRSALYYPYTSIQSEGLIRTSLLLWDRLHLMVPWDGFFPSYDNPDHARALELIGVQHVPTHEEKKQAHEIVEDFATRPLPEAFSYASKGHGDDWPVYAEKLLPETWQMLNMTGRAGSRTRGGVPVTKPTGLSLLSLLADCCAGQSLPLTKLISFREREEKSTNGQDLRALRHRYLDRLSTQAAALARFQKEADRADLRRQFKQDMKDDLRQLHSELRLSAEEALTSKELLAAVLAGAAALAAPFFNFHLPDVVSVSAKGVSIGGLLALRTKFVKSRHDVLKNHPMAYLYELKGGLRI